MCIHNLYKMNIYSHLIYIIYTHTCFLYNKSLIVGFYQKLHIMYDHLTLQNSTWLHWPVLESLTPLSFSGLLAPCSEHLSTLFT